MSLFSFIYFLPMGVLCIHSREEIISLCVLWGLLLSVEQLQGAVTAMPHLLEGVYIC